MSLAIGAGLSLILRWHFERFGSTLSNRSEFAQVFPLIVLTTVLIITVVKSSLALSLGLVGALSIVRFRTPIKEPEELAYLFIAIAIGLGLGADQHVATTVAAAIILTIVARITWKYPALVASGRGIGVLDRYRFLFHRFTQACYFFGVFFVFFIPFSVVPGVSSGVHG